MAIPSHPSSFASPYASMGGVAAYPSQASGGFDLNNPPAPVTAVDNKVLNEMTAALAAKTSDQRVAGFKKAAFIAVDSLALPQQETYMQTLQQAMVSPQEPDIKGLNAALLSPQAQAEAARAGKPRTGPFTVWSLDLVVKMVHQEAQKSHQGVGGHLPQNPSSPAQAQAYQPSFAPPQQASWLQPPAQPIQVH